MAKLYDRPGKFEIRVDTLNKGKDEYMNENAFSINVIASTELVDLFAKHGITRRGQYTWSLSDTPENHRKFIGFYQDYQKQFTPYTLHAGEGDTFLRKMKKQHDSHYSQPLALTTSDFTERVTRFLPTRTIVANYFGYDNISDIPAIVKGYETIKQDYKYNFVSIANDVYKDNYSPFVIVMSYKHNTLYFRLKLTDMVDEDYYSWNVNLRNKADFGINMFEISGLYYKATTSSHVYLKINQLMKNINLINKHYNGIFTEESEILINNLTNEVKDSLFINTAKGNSNRASVISAMNTHANLIVPNRKRAISLKPFDATEMAITDALNLSANNNYNLVIHPSLIDLQNMVNAKEYDKDDRLYGYQRRAVGLQLSTQRGFVNSLDTGIGKSVVQLTAMRERSKSINNYRGMIVCQSNTVKQWREYMEKDKWFPEAKIVIVNSSKCVDKLVEVMAEEGPVVVIITFNMIAQVQDLLDEKEEFENLIKELSGEDLIHAIKDYQSKRFDNDMTIGDVLVNSYWHDLCADEATSIRNNASSKQSQALWHMRQNSDIATALTATPFNKSITDIERLLSWVRNDKRMFYGSSLAKIYDTENLTANMAKSIFNTLYPMVFRFTKEEAVAEEKDKIKIPEELAPETILLKPSPAELALSQACEYELKRIITELEDALNNFEAKTDAEKAELDAARDELKNAHGHWMAGTNIARMATSNPASILKSKSIAAQLLISQGLVHNAMQDIPTKQKALLEHASKKINDGKQILVFTDFVDVAENLAQEFEKIGIRAGVFGGTNLKKRDENRIAFQDEKLDVLVCTKAAERGLTLHRASVTYHYDLSWTLEPLLQKAGRAARVGSKNENVETYFIVLQGTIEEKVIDRVFSQGTLSTMVLDNSRGVDISKTTTGKLMGGLMDASTNINSRKGALEFGKALLNV